MLKLLKKLYFKVFDIAKTLPIDKKWGTIRSYTQIGEIVKGSRDKEGVRLLCSIYGLALGTLSIVVNRYQH